MIHFAKRLLDACKGLFEWPCRDHEPQTKIVHHYDGFNTGETIALLKFTLGPSWDIWQELVGDAFSICLTRIDPDYMTIIPPETNLYREAGGILIEFEDSSIPSEYFLLSRNGKGYDYITDEAL